MAIKIQLRNYQEGGYVTPQKIDGLINHLIAEKLFGEETITELDEKKNEVIKYKAITIELDCSGIEHIKYAALKRLGDFSLATETNFSFISAGFSGGSRYNGLFENYKKRKGALLEKVEKLKVPQEQLYQKFYCKLPSSLQNIPLRKMFRYLLSSYLNYLRKSMKDLRNESKYLKDAKESQLQVIIKKLCISEGKNFKRLEPDLIRILEECRTKLDLETRKQFVLDEFNRLGVMEGDRYKVLTGPFREKRFNEPQDLENMVLDLIELIGFVGDSKKEYRWLLIREKEAVRVGKILRKLLEKRGEAIFKNYKEFIKTVTNGKL